MNSDLPKSILFEHLGTASPTWQLDADNDILHLISEDRATRLTAALDAAQAISIRRFNGVTSHTAIDILIMGKLQKLNLVGRRIDSQNWAGTASDYTDTQTVARGLAHGLAFAEHVVSEVNSLVVVIDHNSNIQRFNRLCEELTGLREEDVVGRNVHAFMPVNEQAMSRATVDQFFESSVSYEIEGSINTLKGPRRIHWRNKFVQSGSGPEQRYLICSGTDVTEERMAQVRLHQLANVDTLTGLPNRHAMHEHIRSAQLQGRRFGLLFLDLDNFKKVNDHYGHVTGDSLIQAAARVIKSCLRGDDTASRIGGDEFLILLDNASLDAVEAVARRILERLDKPITLGMVSVYTGCSIGIALCPENGETLDELIRNADMAMYVAKDAGKRTYRVFSPEMNSKVAQYMWLETNLHKAIANHELELHYQPKLCLQTGAVRSAEALIRWNSPERGRIAPLDFIPYAEESGLIVPLGKWVLETAAKQASAWAAQNMHIRVAVNLSARQLCDSTIVADFSEALRLAGQAGCLIDLELTESCLIEDEVLAHAVIKQFRELGAEVHLDDFGTGYSSLSQLARLPLDVIKLDRSFISDINQNRTSQALVRSMVAVAQELQLKVVAEGVENEAEADFLKSLNVDYAQGYLFGRPMPAAEFEEWLQRRRPNLRVA